MSEKIILETCNLAKQKIIEARLYELELFDTHFALKLKFRAEEPQQEDEKLPWIEVDNDFEMAFPKSRFAGLEKAWLQEDKRWKITISIDGVGTDLRLYFRKQLQADDVFKRLLQYLILEGFES